MSQCFQHSLNNAKEEKVEEKEEDEEEEEEEEEEEVWLHKRVYAALVGLLPTQ